MDTIKKFFNKLIKLFFKDTISPDFNPWLIRTELDIKHRSL